MKVSLQREDFIMQYPPINLLKKESVDDIWQPYGINLYVHLPYCIAKCGFCYYKTFVNKNIPDEYFMMLMKELDIYLQKYDIGKYKINTIYLGGGTPTLMNENQVSTLFRWFHKNLKLSENIEITVEARPGSESSRNKLKLLREYGVTRLSIGCQSLNDEILRINGRNHKVSHFYQIFQDARDTGINNINVDLMSGMINETDETWRRTLIDLINLRPQNIAIYKMQIYLNNKLYLKLREEKTSVLSNEEEYELYVTACRMLMDNGYLMCDHFSFAVSERYFHTHRLNVWGGEDMLGVGLSSHSCLNGYLFQNDSNLKSYYDMIAQGKLPISRAYKISVREKMIQNIVFGLKLTRINRKKFFNRFGIDVLDIDSFAEIFQEMREKNLVEIYDHAIKTTFTGSLYADDLAREFYLPEHIEMMLGHISRM